MSKKRNKQSDYTAIGFLMGFLANATAGTLATIFGVHGALFYGRKLDIVDLGAVVLGIALLLGAGYFAYQLNRTIKG